MNTTEAKKAFCLDSILPSPVKKRFLTEEDACKILIFIDIIENLLEPVYIRILSFEWLSRHKADFHSDTFSRAIMSFYDRGVDGTGMEDPNNELGIFVDLYRKAYLKICFACVENGINCEPIIRYCLPIQHPTEGFYERDHEQKRQQFYEMDVTLSHLWIRTRKRELDYIPPSLGGSENRKHSADFTSVHWYGSDFTFNKTQAAIIAHLWKEMERGTWTLKDRTIQKLIGLDNDSFRLQHYFRNHPAFKVMIKAQAKGIFRLSPPQIAVSTKNQP